MESPTGNSQHEIANIKDAILVNFNNFPHSN